MAVRKEEEDDDDVSLVSLEGHSSPAQWAAFTATSPTSRSTYDEARAASLPPSLRPSVRPLQGSHEQRRHPMMPAYSASFDAAVRSASLYAPPSSTSSNGHTQPWYTIPQHRPCTVQEGQKTNGVEGQDETWDDRLGGDYLHGVGYDDDADPLGDELERAKLDARRRLFVEKHLTGSHAHASSRYEDERFPSRGWKERVRLAKERRKWEKKRTSERTGVDDKGRLVFETGKWRRIGVRVGQAVGPVVVASGSIAAALGTHPKSEPPTAGSAAAWLMYVSPLVSLGQSVYMPVVRPVRANRKQQAAAAMHGRSPFVFSNASSPSNKKGKPAAYPAVNLMLDASLVEALSPPQRAKRTRRPKKTDDLNEGTMTEEDSEEDSDAWSDTSEPGRHYRKAILSRVAAETKWRAGRRALKMVTVVDVAFALLWSLAAVYVLGWSPKCPAGAFDGYCNLYNVAVAFSVMTALVYWLSIGSDVIDLRQSSIPPRMRM